MLRVVKPTSPMSFGVWSLSLFSLPAAVAAALSLFGDAGPALLDACLAAGCQYVDIADDRSYAALVRSYGERFRSRGLTAVYGCSSLPGISGALALAAAQAKRATGRPAVRARVTMMIGNNNPKGLAAIRSAVAVMIRRLA